MGSVVREMGDKLPKIYLARHGETAWNLTGQHMGRIDMQLTEQGEGNARRLGKRLRGLTFAKVFTSPLQRASRTCELAGFKAAAVVDPDLLELNGITRSSVTSQHRVIASPAVHTTGEQRHHTAAGRIINSDATMAV